MKRKTILLADDDRDDTEMFCEALIEIDKDINCFCSVNGEELLLKLNNLDENPQLIFLDLNMPIMNGWQCLDNLKKDKRYKDIPVIIISTSSHNEEMKKAIKLGALCYFVKPNTFDELKTALEAIAKALQGSFKDSITNLLTGVNKHIFTCGS